LQMQRCLVTDAVDGVEDDIRPLQELIEPQRRLLQTAIVLDEVRAPSFAELANPFPRPRASSDIGETNTGNAEAQRRFVIDRIRIASAVLRSFIRSWRRSGWDLLPQLAR